MTASAPDHWEPSEQGLQRTFVFTDFAEALGFVVETGRLAETADHHPDIDIRWNKVHLALITHSEGRVTEKDHQLATAINNLSTATITARRDTLFA